MARETKNGRKKKKVNTPPLTSLQPLPKSNLQRSQIPGVIKDTGIDKIGTPSPINGCKALVLVGTVIMIPSKLRAYIIAEYRHNAMSDGKMIIGGIGISSKKPLNLAQTIVPKTIARPIAVPINIASVAAASSTLKLQ